MKLLTILLVIIAVFVVIKVLAKRKKPIDAHEKELDPDFRTYDHDAEQKAKNKAKNMLNQQFNLKGKHDDKIDKYAEKVFNKVDSKHILSALNLAEKLKKSKTK